MDKYISKLQNFWFYYKKHLLIALAVLAVIGYLGVQSADSVEADYHIGLVQSVPCSEEYLNDLKNRFTAAAEDVNGDGEILVEVHTYFVDLADESPDAGVNNFQVVAALDADLIGHTSGIFLLEDVETFHSITNDAVSGSAVPFGDGLSLVLRTDADDGYIALAARLN